jgi:fibronectin type 3 domain-containing protein
MNYRFICGKFAKESFMKKFSVSLAMLALALAFGFALVSCDMGSTSNNAALLPAPTGITATRITGGSIISLSWNAVSGTDGYRVYRSTTGGDDVGVRVPVAYSGSITSGTFGNNRNDQTNYVSMSTMNKAGKEGPRSPWVPVQ